MELNFEGLEMQKGNVPTIDEKNGVICLIIMFTQEDLLVALKFFAQTVTNFFAVVSRKYKKAMFYILTTITLEVNIIFITFKNILTPFFCHLLFELCLLVDLIFAFQELQNSISELPTIFLMFWSTKYTFDCQ